MRRSPSGRTDENPDELGSGLVELFVLSDIRVVVPPPDGQAVPLVRRVARPGL